jgi:hypothetical protein
VYRGPSYDFPHGFEIVLKTALGLYFIHESFSEDFDRSRRDAISRFYVGAEDINVLRGFGPEIN